jgi:DNA-binding NtrC family response regulator
MVSINHQYQLLFADDDPGFRETLRTIFEPHFDLIEARSGEEAIELAGRISFDLVLLDMHMEELTGLETLRVIKTIHVVAPCILITGDATTELEAEATDDGAYSVLKKPVRKSELVTTVSTALQDAYDDGDYLAALR